MTTKHTPQWDNRSRIENPSPELFTNRIYRFNGPDGELYAEIHDPPVGGSVFHIVLHRSPPWPRVLSDKFGNLITELLR